MEQSSNKSRAFMSNLDDQQLRQILLAEVESDDTDVDLIRNITAVLESRDRTGTEIDAKEAYLSFMEEHSEDMPLYDELLKRDNPTKKHKPVRVSRLTRVGIVAAIIISLITVTTCIASAAGIDVWSAITRWTEKTFGVTIGYQNRSDDYGLSHDACQDLRQTLARNGVTDNVVPYYLPDGYTLLDSFEQTSYEGTVISAIYKCGSSEILLLFSVGTESTSSMYPKDHEEPEIYERGNISHYLFANMGEWTAIWRRNNISCQISGVSSKDELLNILDSIYEGK